MKITILLIAVDYAVIHFPLIHHKAVIRCGQEIDYCLRRQHRSRAHVQTADPCGQGAVVTGTVSQITHVGYKINLDLQISTQAVESDICRGVVGLVFHQFDTVDHPFLHPVAGIRHGAEAHIGSGSDIITAVVIFIQDPPIVDLGQN